MLFIYATVWFLECIFHTQFIFHSFSFSSCGYFQDFSVFLNFMFYSQLNCMPMPNVCALMSLIIILSLRFSIHCHLLFAHSRSRIRFQSFFPFDYYYYIFHNLLFLQQFFFPSASASSHRSPACGGDGLLSASASACICHMHEMWMLCIAYARIFSIHEHIMPFQSGGGGERVTKRFSAFAMGFLGNVDTKASSNKKHFDANAYIF